MIIHYHEMSALLGVGSPGKKVTLNDLHKAAWAIYTGTGKMLIPKGVERPFTFRADEDPGRPGVYLFTIRSPFEFSRAKPKVLELEEGKSLSMEFPLSPYKRIESRRITPKESEWERVATSVVNRCGVQVEHLDLARLPSMSMLPNQVRHPIVMVTASGVITDPATTADMWLRGATPMRAYGMGQLTLLPASELKAQAA